MLAKKNSETNLTKRIEKNEQIPACVTAGDSLIEFYEKTDLSFIYCYEQCKTLKPLKGIDITLQMVEFWYREFIRAGWNKKWFDKQLKAVKQKQLFNRIDIADWFEAEIMYNELDFNRMVEKKINNMIQHAKFLKDYPNYELTEEDKKCVELELAQEQIFKSSSDYYANRENYKNERRKQILKQYE